MAIKGRLDTGKMFRAVLIGFITLQVLSWILDQVGLYPLIKGGPMILLFLVVILFSTLFVLGRKIGDLSIKKDLLFVLIVFGAIGALFVYLPQYIPQIFSASGLEVKEILKEISGIIIRSGTGVVGIGN